jgi:hypothetical protein
VDHYIHCARTGKDEDDQSSNHTKHTGQYASCLLINTTFRIHSPQFRTVCKAAYINLDSFGCGGGSREKHYQATVSVGPVIRVVQQHEARTTAMKCTRFPVPFFAVQPVSLAVRSDLLLQS